MFDKEFLLPIWMVSPCNINKPYMRKHPYSKPLYFTDNVYI